MQGGSSFLDITLGLTYIHWVKSSLGSSILCSKDFQEELFTLQLWSQSSHCCTFTVRNLNHRCFWKLRDSVGMQDFFAPLNVSPSLSFLNARENLLLFGELRCSSNKRSLWNLQESYCLAREASGHTDSRWSKSSKMERLSQLGSLEKFGLSEGQ